MSAIRTFVVYIYVFVRVGCHAVPQCFPDGVPEANRKNINVGKVSLPIGIWDSEWDSCLLVNRMVQVLLSEVMGFNVVVSGSAPSGGSVPLGLSGCFRDKDGNLKCPPGALPDDHPHHVNMEYWSSAEWIRDQIRDANVLRLPELVTLLDYVGREGVYLPAIVRQLALEELGQHLEFYGSWDAHWNTPGQFFDKVAGINASRLTPCSRTRFADPLEMTLVSRFTPDLDGIDDSGHAKCVGGVWWLAPACRSNASRCVPLITSGDGYYLRAMMQKAIAFNMPLAIAVAPWSDYLTLPYELKMLVYNWEPAAHFLRQSPVQLVSPPADAAAQTAGDMRTEGSSTPLYIMVASSLRAAAPRVYEFLSSLRLSTADVNSLLTLFTSLGDHHAAACSWLKNTSKWQEWIPDERHCTSGRGLTDAEGGFVQNYSLGVSCSYCPAGFFSAALAGTETRVCKQCPPGTSQKMWGFDECQPCDLGLAQSSFGQDACERCGRGFFANESGSTRCAPCPHDKTTDGAGYRRSEDCLCSPGSFLRLGLDDICDACPEGMTCSLGSKAANIALYSADKSLPIPQVKPGYYTRSSEPLSVYLCDGADAKTCPGGPPATCGGGLQGLVCQTCPDGQALQDGVCTNCDSGPSVLIYVVLPVALGILAIIMFKCGNGAVTVNVAVPLMVSVLVSLFITTLQTLALFPGLSIEWRSQGDFFVGFKFFLGNPEAWAGGIRLVCALSAKPLGRYLFSCLLPVLCVLAVLVVWGMSLAMAKVRRQEGWNINVMCNTLGQLLQAVFIGIAVLVVQPLRCYGHPNHKSSMTSFPSILCWGEDDTHTSLVAMGIILGMVFVIPFLALCIRALVQAPKSVDPVGHCQRWRFLLYRFRTDVWWWGIVVLLRQLALAFSCCIPADSPHWQITYVAAVTSFYLIALCLKQPWKNMMLNYVDLCSMVLVNFIIISSSSFVVKRTQDVQSFVVFHFCILALFSVFVLYVLGTSVFWAKVHGVHGDYGQERELGKISKAWADFVKVSALIDPQVITQCINTFTQFDVHNLVKAMGSFQSVDDTFGGGLAPRLKTISHSSKDMKGLSDAVRHSMSAPQDSSQENANKQYMVII